MSYVIIEARESGAGTDGDDKSRERIYKVFGTDSDAIARALARSAAPYTIDGLKIKSVSAVPMNGERRWTATVSYGKQDEEEPGGGGTISFETGGGSQHITQSIRTVGQYKGSSESESIPKTGGAIGLTKDSVEGVDVQVPQFTWQETHTFDAERISTEYIAGLFNLTAKTNDAPFKAFKTGEVLFLGSSGSQNNEETVEITFHFSASPNKTGLEIGDAASPYGAITGIAKKGWEYLWIMYEDADDDDAKLFKKVPRFVFVEQVYYDGDFSALGIGT